MVTLYTEGNIEFFSITININKFKFKASFQGWNAEKNEAVFLIFTQIGLNSWYIYVSLSF